MTHTTITYPRTLVVIRDCHAKNNLTVIARTADDEKLYRKMAARKEWKVAVRKRNPTQEPTCDNCNSMELRRTSDGANHRWCDMHGQWIPDTEQSPVCDFHSAVSKFENMMTAKARKGGAL